MQSCHDLCMQLLRAFAIDMGLEEDYFTSRHAFDQEQSSILRLLYYPATTVSPISMENVSDDIRAGAHSDYGTCTLLFQKDIGGLQILSPSISNDSELRWIDVPVVDDAVLVNVGDAFDFWTNGKFKSTIHRVSCPRTIEGSRPRFSIAYFLHPEDSVPLQPISLYSRGQEGDSDNRGSVRNRFGVPTDRILTSKEWLLQRLSSTYGTRKDA
ncbi:uncharacterized protein EI90DRAFT_3040076 [Cantharellus anzutake]|uniref:uncharacterized protein n=1 Tax=Cantharellus anzutake TaxID=1750568 RepID=UPI001905D1D5|nr:uncharacterized protein EI90DRAFT_3040076 [Cantharellus anzutake]KAF8339030.1 hypothetical protein EI90DRAFT_3040076 [Cantharellus anzutake]